ncbi:MAG: (2Fe-2S)-binding protein [Proteobacteria bacterium]|nr:(2Fe-2S)-binding protein [Pseudomonadota bacterium]
MYVCVCNAVRDRDLRQAAESGCRSFKELQALTRVSTCCGRCEPMAREVFDQALERQQRTLEHCGLAVQPA